MVITPITKEKWYKKGSKLKSFKGMKLDNKKSLSKRFKTGLNKNNVEINDIIENWYYIGGEVGIHLKYFNNNFYNQKLPTHQDYCICGHKIKNNCYITNGEDILAIGENCINRFITYDYIKLCRECNSIHRNITDNLCKSCRKTFKIVDKDIIIEF